MPTPITAEKKADLSHVFAAGRSIAPVLKAGHLVILESTSPVGATEQPADLFRKARPDLRFPRRGDAGHDIDVHVAYCPERVLPGKVVEELVANNRAKITAWLQDYNDQRPHSAIGYLTPAVYAAAFAATDDLLRNPISSADRSLLPPRHTA